MKKRTIALLMAVVMLFGATVAGTLAWLKDNTDPVKNTFTVGDINITLTEEHKGPFHILPGAEETKDPKVTVLANSEKCWLFVEVTTTGSIEYVTYSKASGWDVVPGTNDTVWYRVVNKTTADTPFDVLNGNKVSYSPEITKGQLEKATAPTLTFTAYAVQYEASTTPEGAWALAKN